MNPDTIRAHLALLGWSQAELARRLGLRRAELVQRWCRGAPGYAMPENVGDWLARCSKRAEQMPLAPEDWRRR